MVWGRARSRSRGAVVLGAAQAQRPGAEGFSLAHCPAWDTFGAVAAQSPCMLVVTNSPAHVAGVRSPSWGGKVWGRAGGPRGDRSLEGALSLSNSQIHSRFHILGVCLHPIPPASSSLAWAPGGQRLLQRHKRGIIARVCGVPCAIFHSLLQAEQPSGS